jgi:HlyD family secretion protein
LADLQLAEAQAAMALARQRRLLNGVRPSELEEARALQVGAAAAYRRAERLAQRTQELVSRGAASPQALDDEITQLATLRAAFDAADARLRTLAAPPREEDAAAADAEVEAARARVELARAALARSQITAPFDLQVLRIMAEPGELAGPQDLRPLLIVCDTNTLRVRAEVEEFDALQIELHQPVRITTDAENSPPMSGRVSQIAARMRQKQLHDERPNERLDATVREVWIDLYPDAKTAGRNCELVIGLPVEVCFLPHDTAVASIAD